MNGGAFNKNNFSAERAHYTQKKTRTLEDGTTHEYIELVSYASNNVDEVTVPTLNIPLCRFSFLIPLP